jgi:hypothetical protein
VLEGDFISADLFNELRRCCISTRVVSSLGKADARGDDRFFRRKLLALVWGCVGGNLTKASAAPNWECISPDRGKSQLHDFSTWDSRMGVPDCVLQLDKNTMLVALTNGAH